MSTMSEKVKMGIIIAVVEAILALLVNLAVLRAQTELNVKTASDYFGSIDKSMTYEQIMSHLYDEYQSKDEEIKKLKQENENLKMQLTNSTDSSSNNDSETVKYLKEISTQIGLANMCAAAQEWMDEAKTMQKSDRERQKRFEQASIFFECVLLTEPSYETALLYYGGLCWDFEQYDDALDLWERLVEIQESDYYYYLCAIACSKTTKAHMVNTFCAKGLSCPDTGSHARLKKLISEN